MYLAKQLTIKAILIFFLGIFQIPAMAQEDVLDQKRVYFPYPMDRNWQFSAGFIATTLVHEITEEVRFRVPALDLHAMRRVNDQWYLDGRINFQLLQNLVSLGPRWTKKLSEKLSMSLGNDLAFWMGIINTRGFEARATGWLNYPNISLGYKLREKLLFTLKAESLMTFGKVAYAGETRVSRNHDVFNGSAYSFILEQPFYGNKSVTLGFRAIYTNFHWQTWALFENYDRNLFYPQLIVGIIL
jgi:hypothetical protein